MHEMQTIGTDVRGVCQSVTNAPNDPGSASLCRVREVIRCSLRQMPLATCFTDEKRDVHLLWLTL